MNCFICNDYLPDVRAISKHFRFIHRMNEKDTYRCTYREDCNRFYSSLSNLNRHFKGHLQLEVLTNRNTELVATQFAQPFQALSAGSHTSNSEIPSTSVHPFNNTSIPVETSLICSEESCDDAISCAALLSQNDTLSIEEGGVAFALQLHSNNNLTRKDVIEIQKNVMRNLVRPIVGNVSRSIQEEYGSDLTQRLFMTSLTEEISNPFRNCVTEHKLFQWLLANDFICNYDEFTINKQISEVCRLGETSYGVCEITGVLLPISFQFKKFFEKNDQLVKTLSDMKDISRNPEVNSHFIHGLLWREKSKSFVDSGKIVLPFFLYIDDSELNNPLGPHCDPISFLYYSFPVIKNSEIYLAATIKARDYKEFGNEKCLRALVQEIRYLEENGIAIETSEGVKTVYFILGLFLGDNLGLNTVLGFTSSFAHNFFCRFCKVPKSTTHTLCSENSNFSRNINNYTVDVAANDIQSTGIKENSILNSIKSFHSTTNFAVDIMHDLFEGVCHYDMCHVITHLIDQKYFSLQTLNIRKHMFNYGEIEIGNISPEITSAHLSKFHLKMTAREMMCFMHFFPLMVGDLVPSDDEVWLFLLNLMGIIEILLAFEISHDLAERLQAFIKHHHSEYTRLFPDTLKPKHHLMLHYLSVILQSGPPRHYWCFRFEAFHKEFKTYARNITSRKNICVSLAKKYQLKFAHSIMQSSAKFPYNVQEHHRTHTNHHDLVVEFCKRRRISPNFVCYSKCLYNSKVFKKGYFISQYNDTLDIQNAIIFEIVGIVLFANCDTPHLICKHVKIDKYHSHYAAYAIEVSRTSENNKYNVVSIDSLAGPPVNAHKTARGLNMFRPKQYC